MEPQYFIERLEGGRCNFNLWQKDGPRYFNLATLFYDDPYCGTQWTVSDKNIAVSHSADDIYDELESPLQSIPADKAERILGLRAAQEAAASIERFL